jgi:Lamin Tail Domain
MKKSIMVMMILIAALSLCACASTQLGSVERPNMKVISQEILSVNATENINPGATSKDVTKLANVSAIFGARTAATINIVAVNAMGEKWVEISNQGTASGNLTGWILQNQQNLTYAFPVFVLDSGSEVRVHGGMGLNNETALYTNATEPLVNDTADVITLLDASGAIVAKYDFNASAPASTTSARSPEKLPLLVNDNSARNPELAPILINDNSTRDPEKQPLLINTSASK